MRELRELREPAPVPSALSDASLEARAEPKPRLE
jgi:hypothetical protein